MKVYIFLAEGFETVEALAPVDVFRRAGVDIQTVSITNSLAVTSSQGITIQADCRLKDKDLDDGSALILPGGYPGYQNLADCVEVGEATRNYYESGRIVGAICGAPTILKRYGIAEGRRITCHHTVKGEMGGYVYTGKDVEQDHNLISAIGAGHAFEFGLAILYALQGFDKVAQVKTGLELK